MTIDDLSFYILCTHAKYSEIKKKLANDTMKEKNIAIRKKKNF